MSLIRYCQFLVCAVAIASCNNSDTSVPDAQQSDTLTEEQRHLPENALKGLQVADGLEVKAMASEPMLRNPTNIDVDERGRVWVTEAYNYRPAINGNPVNPKGDRIMILEDTNGDGVTDSAKVYYQGPEINAPLGVCVLGDRVLISQAPYLWALYDDNGDDKADRKEVIFQTVGGEQHDHGLHAFSFGPDGKLYFNFGNDVTELKDKNGKAVLDQDGDKIGPGKYKMGMVFRCDPDGSHVECLGQNFRNNYEVAVDSYGTLWQSDNDDDGNRSVRINYVMEYGNYGFSDEITGAGWSANRTNLEDSIPLRHWHQNDPGVVPNLLITGAGSPTGMLIYEGSLLPKQFYGQMIHSDAGPNVVRSYPVKKNGAGYSAEIINILNNEKDRWFRPADVCVAPDGSLIVADWYDPGVGGHAAGDQQRGRIYRVAPPGTPYTMPTFDYTSPSGAVQALQNPNLAVRRHAWYALQNMKDKAVPELEKLWRSSADPRMRARALWALVKMPGDPKPYIQEAIKDNMPEIRITGLRAARELKSDVIGVVSQLVDDKDAQVRRECAIALHHNPSLEAAGLWTALAVQHDAADRWELEALGIGADRQWDKFFAAFVDSVKDPLKTPGYRDIVWRARTEAAIPFLARLAVEPSDLSTRLRYFRAFDFHPGSLKNRYLLKMLEDTVGANIELKKVILRQLNMASVKGSPLAQKALNEVIKSYEGTMESLELTKKYEQRGQIPMLLRVATGNSDRDVSRSAADLLLYFGAEPEIWKVINGGDTAKTRTLLKALGGIGNKQSLAIFNKLVFSTGYSMDLRHQAAAVAGRSGNGEDAVLTWLDSGKVPKELVSDLASGIKTSWRGSVRERAEAYLSDGQSTVSAKKMPSMEELRSLKAVASNGKAIFKNICATCHQVGNEGADFGPKLTEIGSKLPKEGVLEAILHPSDGISFGYETSSVTLKDGSTLSGIIASKTETETEIKLPGGSTKKYKSGEIASIKELKASTMPEGLHQLMSAQELADLLEYLDGLKKK